MHNQYAILFLIENICHEIFNLSDYTKIPNVKLPYCQKASFI